MAVRAGAEPLKPPPARRRIVDEYLDHLRVERGLSVNTLVAYGRDLARLAAFSARRPG